MDNNQLIERVLNKLDSLDDRIGSIDSTLASQHRSLEHHIERTSLAEENIKLIRTDIKPIQKHVHMIEGALKLIGLFSAILGILKLLSII